MKKILFVIISLFIILPCAGKNIYVKRHASTQHGILHIPSASCVHADYVQDQILINIIRYTGAAQVKVYDNNNVAVKTKMTDLVQSGEVAVDVTDLPHGEYTLEIELDNGTYVGTFEITD